MKTKTLILSALTCAILLACGGGSGSSSSNSGDGDSSSGLSPGAATGDFTSGVTAINNPTPLTEIQPSPPSIGADVPATYFGTAPSTVQKELIGPYQLLKAGTLDTDAGTITLPLYKGLMKDGRLVWYILYRYIGYEERRSARLEFLL